MATEQPKVVHYNLPDGYRCAARVWNVDEPASRAIFLHGVISHGGWYVNSCAHLASNGIEVHFLDRRGSGLNTVARGDVDCYQTWLSDVEIYLAGLPVDVPKVLIGISWGGKVASVVARRSPELIDGIGLLCPGLFARQYPPAWKYVALSFASAIGLSRLRIPIPLQDPQLFTNSLDWQHYIRADPATLRQVTVRFAMTDRKLTQDARDALPKIQAPSLLMLAGKDRIVDNEQTKCLFERSDLGDKTQITYPNAAHTLEFESDPQPFFGQLAQWARNLAAS